MLAATVSACAAAWVMRATWPSWRLPMVGTKASRPIVRRAARKLSMVVWICMPRGSVAMFGGGKGPILHGGHVAGYRLVDAGRAVHEIANETGLLAGIDPQHVMEHQHLSVTLGPGADADGGHGGEAGGQFCGQGGRHHLHHHQGGTRLLQGQGVRLEAGGVRFAAALHPVAAQLVHGLGSQADRSEETRLNSSHHSISYAVFCLKKK